MSKNNERFPASNTVFNTVSNVKYFNYDTMSHYLTQNAKYKRVKCLNILPIL